MFGKPDDGRKALQDAETYLVKQGFEVVNPYKLGLSGDWLDNIIVDLQHLKKCHAIVMLEGWQESYGCRIEYLVAQKLGIPIVTRLYDMFGRQ